MKLISAVFVLLLGTSFFAQALELNIAPATRTYPFSASLEAGLRHEYLLWDQRDSAAFKFGFIQPKLTLGAHGLSEVGLNFYPISIVELGGGYSLTSRFYDTKTFNCEDYICRGIVQRHRWTARLVGGAKTESGDWILMATHHRIRISHSDDSKPLVDEVEVLACPAGGDVFEADSVLVGIKKGTETFGAYAKKGRYLEAGSENQAQYLIYRRNDGAWSYAGGVGRYASDFSQPGFSAYATLIWTWGNSISLL